MHITLPTALLGGLSPQAFMRRHWQKKPLLIRQAVPGGLALVTRQELFDLAARDEVASRLVRRQAGRWKLAHGPFRRSALPAVRQSDWTLLVQGLDLHLPAAHELLARFRFVPDVRLDDVMLSYASDGGGVGPHVDSYDVFLLQTQGRRRWRVGRVGDTSLQPNVPLKILARFEPEHDWLLEPGDMLYLPPGWAHEGVAVGECMTASIGFRAPGRDQLASEVLQRLLDSIDPPEADRLYRDPGRPATRKPGRIEPALQAFAAKAVARLLADPHSLECALGEVLTEPKPQVVFASAEAADTAAGVRLDRRSRMMYDTRFVFINGESFRAAGPDRRLMRRLADRQALTALELAGLSDEAHALVADWARAGWLHSEPSSV
jgi:50S ribosomal protein L16 3-hydroxylase